MAGLGGELLGLLQVRRWRGGGGELHGLLQVGGGGKRGCRCGRLCVAACIQTACTCQLTYCCVYRCNPDAQVEHNMERGPRGWRLLTLYAELKAGDSGADAKTLPDFESAGACWVSAEELKGLPLR